MIEGHYCYLELFSSANNKHHMETDPTMNNFNADRLMNIFINIL